MVNSFLPEFSYVTIFFSGKSFKPQQLKHTNLGLCFAELVQPCKAISEFKCNTEQYAI